MEVHTASNISETNTFHDVQRIMAIALCPLEWVALKALSLTRSDNSGVCIQFVPSSCMADLPAAKHMLSPKHGNSTNSPCHRCMLCCDAVADSVNSDLCELANTPTFCVTIALGTKRYQSCPFGLSHPSQSLSLSLVLILSLISIVYSVSTMHSVSPGITSTIKEPVSKILLQQ